MLILTRNLQEAINLTVARHVRILREGIVATKPYLLDKSFVALADDLVCECCDNGLILSQDDQQIVLGQEAVSKLMQTIAKRTQQEPLHCGEADCTAVNRDPRRASTRLRLGPPTE